MADKPRIIIQPDGPYFVHGSVPLLVMAPVRSLHGEPIGWHEFPDEQRIRPIYALCRCGVSEMMPFCDGVHLRIEWDWAETADRTPYESRAQRLAGQAGDALWDDPSLCIGAGFCRTRTTDVWKLINQSGDGDAQARLVEMVGHCPSGRLAYQSPDVESNGDSGRPVRIAVLPGGPFWVQGDITLKSWGGDEYPPQSRRTLCRCGASGNKPFCDGTHSTIRFDQR